MTGTEKELLDLKAELESILSERFESNVFSNENYKGEKMFVTKPGKAVHIDLIPEYKSLVIEHADTVEAANRLTLEDGDLFCPSDFKSKEDLFEAMLNEIED
jgi:hypothetical protein